MLVARIRRIKYCLSLWNILLIKKIYIYILKEIGYNLIDKTDETNNPQVDLRQYLHIFPICATLNLMFRSVTVAIFHSVNEVFFRNPSES